MNPDTFSSTRNNEGRVPFSVSQLIACMASESDILALAAAASEEDQTLFASTVEQFWVSDTGPSKRFLRSLVRKYISRISDVQSEALMNLLLQVLQHQDPDIPDPNQSCYVSFSLPLDFTEKQLSVRIFPYHNDVALRVWEAGATLAEYVLQNPHVVTHRRVVELGAGVGLTGLVMAACPAAHVYCTDFTEMCLGNLQHNINGALRISCGYLEWEAFGNFQEDARLEHTAEMIARADLLVAADVVYDVSAIPALVQTFKRFFLGSLQKEILLASTMRRKETFAVLLDVLGKEGIDCKLKVDGNACAKLPVVFPMNFVQPRKDVNIYSLSMNQS